MEPARTRLLLRLLPAALYVLASAAAGIAMLAAPVPVVYKDSPLVTMPWLMWTALGIWAAGLAVELAAWRLWGWPFCYLLVLYLLLQGADGNVIQQVYGYSSLAVTLAAIVVAETVLLIIGHRISRVPALIAFGSAAVSLPIWALVWQLGSTPDPLHLPLMYLAGLLAGVQAVIQYIVWQRSLPAPRVYGDDEEGWDGTEPGGFPDSPAEAAAKAVPAVPSRQPPPGRMPPEPTPTVGEGLGPWVIRVDEGRIPGGVPAEEEQRPGDVPDGGS